MNLTGKNALILGIGSEMAANIADSLINNGATVYAQYRKRKSTGKHKDKINYIQANLQSTEDCQDLAEEYLKRAKSIDILVYCIGDFLYKDLADISPKEFRSIMDSNLNYAYEIIHYLLPTLRKSPNAKILSIAYSPSTQIKAKSNILPYHIAKMGLVLLTKSLAQSEAKYNIQVNCISPGVVENNKYEYKTPIPLGREARVNEISDTALFLINHEYITGQEIVVDGGWADNL